MTSGTTWLALLIVFVVSFAALVVVNGSHGLRQWDAWIARDGQGDSGYVGPYANYQRISVGGVRRARRVFRSGWIEVTVRWRGEARHRMPPRMIFKPGARPPAAGRWGVFSVSVSHGSPDGLPPAAFVDRVLYIFPRGTRAAARLRSAFQGRRGTRRT